LAALHVHHQHYSNMSHLSDQTTAGTKFKDLKLSKWLVAQCNQMGIQQPTPVQYHCIPSIIEGNDCIACAKTGSGKTLAFVLPILQVLCQEPYGVFAVVITPTRELAKQAEEQFQVLGKPINLRVTLVVGGEKWTNQAEELETRPHIVVCTPGQLCYHIKQNNAAPHLRRVRFLVMDEADKLLSGYFDEHLGPILAALPAKRQTLLLSATMTNAIEELQKICPKKPFYYEHKDPVVTVEELDQRYAVTPVDAKEGYLVQVLLSYFEKFKDNNMIIFTGSRKSCHTVYLMLKELGFSCSVLHSLLEQNQRWEAVTSFKSGLTRILVTTDIACRGLDIPVVNLVINFNVPEPEFYIHRVGRTARAGRAGMAITMVTKRDVQRVHAIEAEINTRLLEFKTNENVVLKILSQVTLAKRESEVEMELLKFDDKLKQHSLIERLTTGQDSGQSSTEDQYRRRKKELKRLGEGSRKRANIQQL